MAYSRDTTAANSDVAVLEAVEALISSLEKATAAVTSTLYVGQVGTGSALQLLTTSATIIPSASAATVITFGENNALDVQMVHDATGESCTLCLTEYSAVVPTVANQIRQTEVSIPATDLTATVDLSMVGESAAAPNYAKNPVRIAVTPGAFGVLTLSAESAAGAKFARYQLRGSV